MVAPIGETTMSAIAFDTLKYVERLTAAGVPDAQAKAEASALRDVLAESLDTAVATKADIRDLKADIIRLENNIEKMEMRLIIRLGAMMAAIVSLGVAAIKLLH